MGMLKKLFREVICVILRRIVYAHICKEAVMLGRQDRWQEELFAAASLESLIPDDHLL